MLGGKIQQRALSAYDARDSFESTSSEDTSSVDPTLSQSTLEPGEWSKVGAAKAKSLKWPVKWIRAANVKNLLIMDFKKVGRWDKFDPARAKTTPGVKKVVSMLLTAGYPVCWMNIMTEELKRSGVDVESQVGVRVQLRQQADKEKKAAAKAEPEATGSAAEGPGGKKRRTSTGQLLKSFVSSVVEGVQVATGSTKPKPLPEIGKRKGFDESYEKKKKTSTPKRPVLHSVSLEESDTEHQETEISIGSDAGATVGEGSTYIEGQQDVDVSVSELMDTAILMHGPTVQSAGDAATPGVPQGEPEKPVTAVKSQQPVVPMPGTAKSAGPRPATPTVGKPVAQAILPEPFSPSVQSTLLVGPDLTRGESVTTKLSLAEEMRQAESIKQGQTDVVYEAAGTAITAVQQPERPALSTSVQLYIFLPFRRAPKHNWIKTTCTKH